MRTWRGGLAWLSAASLLTGCALLDGPDATGVVAGAAGDAILVDFDIAVANVGDEAWVALPHDAPELDVGDRVTLWLPLDSIAESAPPQISASRVEVDE